MPAPSDIAETAMMTEVIAVLVAVPTFRRPHLLSALLAEIDRQCTDADALRTRIVVIDNDPAMSAESATRNAGAEYLFEPTPGIAAVRQCALDHARTDELVVMVDDDVFPEPGWLASLVAAWRPTRPAAILGYVRYVWPSGTDPWIAAGGFMRRSHHSTGTRLTAFVTGNVLIDPGIARELGVRFDTSLGLAGGEDVRFGADLLAAGGTIIACSESVCRDDIPTIRATRGFVRTRTIAHGTGYVQATLRERKGAALLIARVQGLFGGIVRWISFTALHLCGRLSDNIALDAQSQRRAWFAIGRMLGSLGRRRDEYAR